MARGVWPAPSPDAQDQAPEDSAPGEASSTLGHERGPARASNSPTLRGRGASPPLATWKLPASAAASRGSVWENSGKAVCAFARAFAAIRGQGPTQTWSRGDSHGPEAGRHTDCAHRLAGAISLRGHTQTHRVA